MSGEDDNSDSDYSVHSADDPYDTMTAHFAEFDLYVWGKGAHDMDRIDVTLNLFTVAARHSLGIPEELEHKIFVARRIHSARL